jgi:hypothetical protein
MEDFKKWPDPSESAALSNDPLGFRKCHSEGIGRARLSNAGASYVMWVG